MAAAQLGSREAPPLRPSALEMLPERLTPAALLPDGVLAALPHAPPVFTALQLHRLLSQVHPWLYSMQAAGHPPSVADGLGSDLLLSLHWGCHRQLWRTRPLSTGRARPQSHSPRRAAASPSVGRADEVPAAGSPTARQAGRHSGGGSRPRRWPRSQQWRQVSGRGAGQRQGTGRARRTQACWCRTRSRWAPPVVPGLRGGTELPAANYWPAGGACVQQDPDACHCAQQCPAAWRTCAPVLQAAIVLAAILHACSPAAVLQAGAQVAGEGGPGQRQPSVPTAKMRQARAAAALRNRLPVGVQGSVLQAAGLPRAQTTVAPNDGTAGVTTLMRST